MATTRKRQPKHRTSAPTKSIRPKTWTGGPRTNPGARRNSKLRFETAGDRALRDAVRHPLVSERPPRNITRDTPRAPALERKLALREARRGTRARDEVQGTREERSAKKRKGTAASGSGQGTSRSRRTFKTGGRSQRTGEPTARARFAESPEPAQRR
jgi:hypothetical protein